ncbi:n-terminal binuclear zn cluster-containing dna binding domain-containing [Trichoderma cornu-damae]|uniref:N-terminal binuclear zn cluster-containing dna binding domain-containing n=1 Tax=Trichoderma cornu-damae TaxID=654480 RepID=A0A9P8QKV7_9HYPO|nr:n-terminal binuclear zn cluster-containing dna binding domain-containing [Trichoderma cornu-damae]
MASTLTYPSIAEPGVAQSPAAMGIDASNPSDGASPYDTSSMSQQPSPRQQPHRHHLGAPAQSQQQQQHQHQHQQQPQRSVKRPRPVKSCTECRKRKLRCDRLCPCSQCQRSCRPCRYAPDQESANLSDGSDAEGAEPGRPAKRNFSHSALPAMSGSACNDGAVTARPAKPGHSTSLPLLEELSIRMERLEKQVLVRSPSRADLGGGRIVAAAPETIRGLTVKRGASRTRYFGQNDPRVLLNLFDDAKAYMSHNFQREPFPSFQTLHEHLRGEFTKALTPITVFVDSMMPIQKRMTDILPKKAICDRLVAAYVDTAETQYRILHLPTFAEQYDHYWEGKPQPEQFLPQMLAVLSVASRFDTTSRGLGHERVEGVHIPTACALVRIWLDCLKGKQLVELSTLQVEVLLLLAQRMVMPRAQDSWNHLGFVVRMAMSMGLHRDPSEFEPRMTVFQGEIRRRLWFTVLDMDLHMSLAANMPCLTRDGDYSCRPPRNLDDSELFPEMTELPPSRALDQTTDNQMQVYTVMTLPTRMKVAHMINRVDTIRDYQEVLDVGGKLDRFIEDISCIFPRHGALSDAQKSRLWRNRVILDMHVRRPLLALYRPFAMAAPEAPPQISRAYLRSCMVILKYLDELDPKLPHFQDISEMYVQMLKRDIIQASLSVCYFIRPAVRPPADSTMLAQQGLRSSPGPAYEFPAYIPDDLMLWSPSRLISTVQKTIDLLVGHIRDSDVKDILCIAVVLETVRKADARSDEITNGLFGLLDACLRASNVTMDKLRNPSLGNADEFQHDSYAHGTVPYMQHGYSVGGLADPATGLGGWIMWDGWD